MEMDYNSDMDELARRKQLGRKLQNERKALGLSRDKVCELINRPGLSKRLLRIEQPSEKPTRNQRAGGATIDVLLLEDLARLYGKSLNHFLSQPKMKRLRTQREIEAASRVDGIRRTLKGSRTFAIVNGSYAAVGSIFDSMLRKGRFVAHQQNNITVYKLAAPAKR
jgi:hypothetical protein